MRYNSNILPLFLLLSSILFTTSCNRFERNKKVTLPASMITMGRNVSDSKKQNLTNDKGDKEGPALNTTPGKKAKGFSLSTFLWKKRSNRKGIKSKRAPRKGLSIWDNGRFFLDDVIAGRDRFNKNRALQRASGKPEPDAVINLPLEKGIEKFFSIAQELLEKHKGDIAYRLMLNHAETDLFEENILTETYENYCLHKVEFDQELQIKKYVKRKDLGEDTHKLLETICYAFKTIFDEGRCYVDTKTEKLKRRKEKFDKRIQDCIQVFSDEEKLFPVKYLEAIEALKHMQSGFHLMIEKKPGVAEKEFEEAEKEFGGLCVEF